MDGRACRAARAILRWTTDDLAKAAGVSTSTINRLENLSDESAPARAGTVAKLTATFAANGVEILDGGKPGARVA